jgi:hypothetical protein
VRTVRLSETAFLIVLWTSTDSGALIRGPDVDVLH